MRIDLKVPVGLHPFVEATVGSLEVGRERVKKEIASLTPEQLAKVPEGFSNSIATLVMHIAGTEANFAYRIGHDQEAPQEVQALYLLDRPQKPLPAPEGATVESLNAALDQARALLVETIAKLGETELAGSYQAFGRDMSRKWLLALLPQHISQHFGQIQMVKRHL